MAPPPVRKRKKSNKELVERFFDELSKHDTIEALTEMWTYMIPRMSNEADGITELTSWFIKCWILKDIRITYQRDEIYLFDSPIFTIPLQALPRFPKLCMRFCGLMNRFSMMWSEQKIDQVMGTLVLDKFKHDGLCPQMKLCEVVLETYIRLIADNCTSKNEVAYCVRCVRKSVEKERVKMDDGHVRKVMFQRMLDLVGDLSKEWKL